MGYDFTRLPKTGIEKLDISRHRVARLAEDTLFAIITQTDTEAVRTTVVRFLGLARDHMVEEQHLLAEEAVQIHWWRYAYLDRVLSELERTAEAEPETINPAHLKVLLEMWSFEQLENAPTAGSGSLRPFEVPPTFSAAHP